MGDLGAYDGTVTVTQDVSIRVTNAVRVGW